MNSLDAGTGPQEGEDDIPDTPEDPISRPGDLSVLGKHRLLCGDATMAILTRERRALDKLDEIRGNR
jgi:hypothetical protein